jgi:hypothetical protein
MSKIVLKEEVPLFPRLDVNSLEDAMAMRRRLVEEHPEYRGSRYRWEFWMEMDAKGYGVARFTVVDQEAFSISPGVFLFFAAIICVVIYELFFNQGINP